VARVQECYSTHLHPSIHPNSKIAELKDQLAEERANLKIMWIPAHVDIGGNERADRAAKDALKQEVATGHEVNKLDYCRWVKEEFKRKRQNDWSNPQTGC
jgi:hypothetical protein